MVSSQHASDVETQLADLAVYERNVACWAEQTAEISPHNRGKWVLIYDAETIHIFDHPAEMFAALEALPDSQRRGAYHYFIRRRPMLRHADSFPRPKRAQ